MLLCFCVSKNSFIENTFVYGQFWNWAMTRTAPKTQVPTRCDFDSVAEKTISPPSQLSSCSGAFNHSRQSSTADGQVCRVLVKLQMFSFFLVNVGLKGSKSFLNLETADEEPIGLFSHFCSSIKRKHSCLSKHQQESLNHTNTQQETFTLSFMWFHLSFSERFVLELNLSLVNTKITHTEKHQGFLVI